MAHPRKGRSDTPRPEQEQERERAPLEREPSSIADEREPHDNRMPDDDAVIDDPDLPTDDDIQDEGLGRSDR